MTVTSANPNIAELAYYQRLYEQAVRQTLTITYAAYLTQLEYPFGKLPSWKEWDANPWVWCCIMVKGVCSYEGKEYEFEEYREGCRFGNEQEFLSSALYRNMKKKVVYELTQLVVVEATPHRPTLYLPAPSPAVYVFHQLPLL